MMTTAANLIIVDTNILLYLYVDNEHIKKATTEKIQSLKTDGFTPAITEQILREFFVVQTNLQKIKRKIDFEILREDAKFIRHNFSIIYPSSESVRLLVEFISKYRLKGKKIHDANIVAVAKANNVLKIFTNNSSDFLLALSEGFEIITL
jgi:predicted nucleic acid-binding protein